MPSGIKGSYKTYNCLFCNLKKRHTTAGKNKFCSVGCQMKYKWVNETIPRIENGECSHHAVEVLKKYLVEKFGEKCSECSIESSWNNKPLVLQLDHKDGDSDNNYPKNLRLLCPNCHSQTDNFSSKGQGSRYKKVSKRNEYLREYKASLI
jgi:hypothetical protein